jgi:CheY-like chemotaxis protein
MSNTKPTGHTILLVDDDEDDRQMLQAALKMFGETCNIEEAFDGKDALVKLSQLVEKYGEIPCLIILDVNMPRMDGRETYLAIRQNKQTATIPIVVFSTSGSETDKSFFSATNTTYLTKPVKVRELVDTAKEMLSHCKDCQDQ